MDPMLDVLPWLSLAVPVTLGLGAVLVPARASLPWANRVTVVAAGLVGLALLGAAWCGPVVSFVRLDAPGGVMLALVGLLGVVVSRYSATYLAGERGLRRYARALLATLSAVTALLISNNLALMALAWVVTSVSLHQLLTFYPDHRPALLAAHKKFILSRLADVCLAVAVGLLGAQAGTLELDALYRELASRPVLEPQWGAAAVLVVAVALRSAQLPFHGWLTQVMEAPTPVSALLHAGVVNLGGFFLIRLAPLLERTPAAMNLLFVIGLSTALLAGLVMMTRVSIKLSLAWSTCAQLGFMLMQCGLGAWDLALLHLVAHSLYKAHAFLNAGATVDAWRVRSQSAVVPSTLVRPLVRVGLVGAGAGWLLLHGVGVMVPLTLSLALSFTDARGGVRELVRLGGLVALAFAWHALAPVLVTRGAPPPDAALLTWLASAGLVSLAAVQVVVRARPDGELARFLQPRLFAGFSLDEYFTRLTFRLWPPPLPLAEPTMRAAQKVASR